MKKYNVLGVNISLVNMSNIVEYIKLNKKKLKGEYICVSNVHTTVSATRNSNLYEYSE